MQHVFESTYLSGQENNNQRTTQEHEYVGEHNLEGKWSKSKKREQSKNAIIIIRKIAFICAHVERILSYGV
jgi:hypothetical protein